jgi:hypothetical protein
MQLESNGFRIETEIAIKAARMGLRIRDLPIDYGPRIGEAKLRGVSDGLAIFLTMLSMLPLYNPRLAFIVPGLLLSGVAITTLALLAGGNVEILGVTVSIYGFVLAAFGLFAGWQLVLTGLAVSLYATAHKQTRIDPLARAVTGRTVRSFIAIAGLALTLAGIVWAALEGPQWLSGDIDRLADLQSLIIDALLLALGLTTLAGAALLSVLAPAAAAGKPYDEFVDSTRTERQLTGRQG